jgi:hypothetical protein
LGESIRAIQAETSGEGTNMRPVAGLLVFSVLAFTPAWEAEAQERAGSVYVAAGATAVHQDGAKDGDLQIYITAPGGTTLGWLVTGGVFAGSRVSVEGEWSSTGMMSAREPARYDQTYHEERRDWLLGANVRFHTRPGRRVDIEPLAGVAAVRHDRWSRTETYRWYMPPDQALTVGPRIRYDTITGVALVTGVDLRVGGRHLALVPSLRVRVVTRGEGIESEYPGGFPKWSVSGGVLARIDF